MPIASHFVQSTGDELGQKIFSFYLRCKNHLSARLILFRQRVAANSKFSQPIRDCVTFQFRLYCRAATHFVLIVKRFLGKSHKKLFAFTADALGSKQRSLYGKEKTFFTFAGWINLRTSLARFMPSGSMKYIACDSRTWLAKAGSSLPWPSFFTASQLFTDKYLL